MTSIRRVAVIDIGKSNAKVALVDLDSLREIAVRKTPNTVLTGPPYPQCDVEAIWRFILEALRALGEEAGVDAISVTTHGATAALLDADGKLALPILDYEFAGPDALAAGYEAVRPDFAETGSPRLPLGLNLGAQLFWQLRMFSEAFARTRTLLPYPQYWTWRLSGVAAHEATSLGCHTDLWNPRAGKLSSMVDKLGWSRMFPPPHKASDQLGPLLPDLAVRTGLSPHTPVFCGIHDSNASLLPHLLSRPPPFCVVSTGTWVVVMALGSQDRELDPARDTLINVDAFGDPVPSARFMGGREYETVAGTDPDAPTENEIRRVLDDRIMLLPAVQPGSGPFQGSVATWRPAMPATDGSIACAASFYLAMMTATCLELAGGRGPSIVEGPFAGNPLFLRMLAAATGRDVVASTNAVTGTSIGAALLAAGDRTIAFGSAAPLAEYDPAMLDYAQAWRGSAG